MTYSKVYSTFYAGVSVTPDATICKQIIGEGRGKGRLSSLFVVFALLQNATHL